MTTNHCTEPCLAVPHTPEGITAPESDSVSVAHDACVKTSVTSVMHRLQALLCSSCSRGSIVTSYMVHAVSSRAISKVTDNAERNATAAQDNLSRGSVQLTTAQSE